MKRLLCLAASCVIVASTAHGQEPSQQAPSRVRSAALVDVMATRGLECGLLRPWQAVALRALNNYDMKSWNPEQREMVWPETARQLAETDCENEMMRVWIEGSSRGFETEMLPPYLVAYRTLALMENPPEVFAATALHLDHGAAVDAIDAKFAELEASGAVAEGGYSWPDYIENTQGFIEAFAATLADPQASGPEADQAAAWLAQSVLVVELWLMDQP
ncbi:MAG: hypothetical protein PVI23_12265 [Maricaulaceae bacterium]|jgi:hypothetical protein